MILTGTPEVFGASLIRPTILSLATLDVDGLTIGSSCYVAETDTFFVIRPSSAVVDHTTVEAVLGYDGLRWIVQGETLDVVGLNVSGDATFDNPITVGGVVLSGVDPGTVRTVSGAAATNIDFTVNSLTDGGWRGWWFFDLGTSGDVDITCQPGNSSTGSAIGGRIWATEGSGTADVTLDTTGTTPPVATKLVLDRAGGNANRARSYGAFEFYYREGIGGFWRATAIETTTAPAFAGGQIYPVVSSIWTETSHFTSLRFNSSSATRIGVGSWIRLQKMGFTA